MHDSFSFSQFLIELENLPLLRSWGVAIVRKGTPGQRETKLGKPLRHHAMNAAMEGMSAGGKVDHRRIRVVPRTTEVLKGDERGSAPLREVFVRGTPQACTQWNYMQGYGGQFMWRGGASGKWRGSLGWHVRRRRRYWLKNAPSDAGPKHLEVTPDCRSPSLLSKQVRSQECRAFQQHC